MFLKGCVRHLERAIVRFPALFAHLLGFYPLFTIDVGNAKNMAQEIDANIAPMRIWDGDSRSTSFRHVLMFAPSKRAIESKGAQLADKLPARTGQERSHV